ncbi:MAG TPA: lipase maturation factor family protein, partial [Myxococcales bacterium]|nr:lipase maturation factor family protein [Myxococcales bacterium]
LSAFISFGVQARGLVGEDGIWPFPRLLEWAGQKLPHPFLDIPSLLWLWPRDAGLIATCALGAACGAALMAGAWARPMAVLCYALYLSLVSAGGLFFGYQWDSLLLEVGFLAMFIAPWAPWLGRQGESPPPAVGLFLARALLFRLMFLSGVVKLTSHDPTWRALRGLQYHYWTQPLPTWTAYFADLMPLWFDQACEVVMFGIELGAPFLLFGPRRVRHLGAGLIAFLQLCIAATGNYGFFNLLTLCLCALQLDDSLWRRVPRLRRSAPGAQAALPALPRARAAAAGWAALAAVLLLLGWVELWSRVHPRAGWPGWVEALAEQAAPFRVVNGYGLFAVMTTEREEIDLSGSADGEHWKSYRFQYKPGPLDERPRFAPLHMPRLDWQMWFAALESCEQNQWLLLLQQGLLEGRPAVRALFAEDPFPDAPPRYVRTRIAPYRFAPFSRWRADGTWWTRGEDRPYCPPLTLEGGRLKAVQQ